MRGLRDVDADVDVGDGGGEAHQEAHQVHHPLGRGERQQEPRGAGLEAMVAGYIINYIQGDKLGV